MPVISVANRLSLEKLRARAANSLRTLGNLDARLTHGLLEGGHPPTRSGAKPGKDLQGHGQPEITCANNLPVMVLFRAARTSGRAPFAALRGRPEAVGGGRGRRR